MSRQVYFILSSLLTLCCCINRPVYKIVLSQKGFAQFLQYDIETPPIREFTFCTWLRVFDLSNDQSIFTYIANGNNRVLRLWLDTGGRHMKISMNGRASSSTFIDVTKNTWRHVCISYQSDFGAWALYLDGRLASCEAAQSLYGFLLPSDGSVIIGYGTSDSGTPNGLEGEIFGANMILTSTIERNYTIKRDPRYQQKLFHKNKLSGNSNIKYIVLNDISIDALSEKFVTTKLPFLNTTRSFIKFNTPHSQFEHDVGLDLSFKETKSIDLSNEKELLETEKSQTDIKDGQKINFWNLVNEAGNMGKFKVQGSKTRDGEQTGSATQELPTISEYETPPPVSSQDYTSFKWKKPIFKTFFETKGSGKTNPIKNGIQFKYEISDIVKPPPLDKNTKVYGQWTSSQFANSVLNYLKNVNFDTKKHQKVPATIPLFKLSDAFPYSSDHKVTKVQPPFRFQRRNFIDKYNMIHKREIKRPEINVEIVKEDRRTQVLHSHARTLPKNVEIINRGQHIESNKDKRLHRNVDHKISSKQVFVSEAVKPRPFRAASESGSISINNNLYKSNNLMTKLPFLKSAEYFVDEYIDKKSVNSNDMYTKSLSNANKWHNVKSYNNDYTPRHVNMDLSETNVNINNNIAAANKKHPSIKLKYKSDNHKVVKSIEEAEILNGRALAMEITNMSNTNSNSVSILKYNHGFLPDYKRLKIPNNLDSNFISRDNIKKKSYKNNFHHHVKIGNALNERFIIGDNEEENKKSFIGGVEKIPDVDRYRSDIDRESTTVPPSLGPKVCKNVEFYNHLFYVQPDGSVDVTQILSPVKEKNIAIEFIAQNYKRCSLEESIFVSSSLLFIDWSKTPVRLFGGSYPKKTTDLCGFF